MTGPGVPCSCASMIYRNHGDGSRDYKMAGKGGCPKCHGTGVLLPCLDCDKCGMLPGSKVCPGCAGYGWTMGLPQEWRSTRPLIKKGA